MRRTCCSSEAQTAALQVPRRGGTQLLYLISASRPFRRCRVLPESVPALPPLVAVQHSNGFAFLSAGADKSCLCHQPWYKARRQLRLWLL